MWKNSTEYLYIVIFIERIRYVLNIILFIEHIRFRVDQMSTKFRKFLLQITRQMRRKNLCDMQRKFYIFLRNKSRSSETRFILAASAGPVPFVRRRMHWWLMFVVGAYNRSSCSREFAKNGVVLWRAATLREYFCILQTTDKRDEEARVFSQLILYTRSLPIPLITMYFS